MAEIDYPASELAVRYGIWAYPNAQGFRTQLFLKAIGSLFALGDRPDDTSWTGFQNYHPNENIGYLTLFREIDNKE
ncbi:MAG: hypothetical protein WD577_04195 [Bacteroidales bacterium]